MKKILFLAFVALATLGLTACGDDENENEGLVGTEWYATESHSEVDEDVTYSYDATITLKFKTATNGDMVVDMIGYTNGQRSYSDSDVEPFTYTYSDGKGTIIAVDEEYDDQISLPFTVSGNQLTITSVDDETGETETVVFTKK